MIEVKSAVLAMVSLLVALPVLGEMACERDLRVLFADADVVLVGRAAPAKEGTAWGRTTSVDLRIEHVVRNRLSGQLRSGSHTNVWVVHASTACCFSRFEPGKQFLVFAAVNSESGLLETDQCRVFSPEAMKQLIVDQARELVGKMYLRGRSW